ncbi:MAG: Dna2/Cas4 domain-containing protein [Ignavibacteriales bacterium]|nr:Dna2/Cas4 domain-containing protein [Ignavibacteriales bacterium]
MNTHKLSKSTFVRGMQCDKSLYLNKHFPELRDEISDSQKAIFDKGTDVGLLARNIFPGGVDVKPETPCDYAKSISWTKKLIGEGVETIYEAAFQFDDVLCAVDILSKVKGKWNLFEVKSSTEVKEVHFWDAALQYYVLTNAGIKLDDIFIVFINKEYVRKGALDEKQLFTKQSVFDSVREKQKEVEKQVQKFKETLASKSVPDIDIGLHCDEPYSCDFKGYCWKHIPSYSVFDISRLASRKNLSCMKKESSTSEICRVLFD